MSYIRNSINAKKGKTISDIEILFHILDKLMDEKLEENPKSGLIMNKGEKNEKRMKYTQAQDKLKALYTYFAEKGTFSIGCCETCSKWNSEMSSTGYLGKCSSNNKMCSCFDTCDNHSKKGGGFGI